MTALDPYGYCVTHGEPLRGGPCEACVEGRPAVDPARRLNVGSGQFPLRYWTNLDESPSCPATLHCHVPPLPFPDGALDDIYAGHFLEHLEPDEADAFLRECWRCLAPGGRLGVVVPDLRAILERWLRGDELAVEYPARTWYDVADLDHVCALFLYSTVQPSRHRWGYDAGTLRRRLQANGFEVVGEIDRYRDARIAQGAWYQCGVDAVKGVNKAV